MAGTGKAHLRRGYDEVVLSVEDLVVDFPASPGRKVHAVSGISFDVVKGETFALVGESGCGKSSTGRAILQLPRPQSGSVVFRDRDLVALSGREVRQIRVKLQMIFQDPSSSLNPRRNISDIVADPLVVWGRKEERSAKVAQTLEAVGLDVSEVGNRRPHQFSGGQCQRISIARALVVEPDMLICDEPVSSLDVSIQAQILNLFEELKNRYGLTILFISHDLAVVRNVSDRVAVMYLGKLCEVAGSDELFDSPLHPYTMLLLSSIPSVAEDDAYESGTAEMPSPIEPPSGCRFRTRCPRATQRCADEEPTMEEVAPGRFVACHHPLLGDSA